MRFAIVCLFCLCAPVASLAADTAPKQSFRVVLVVDPRLPQAPRSVVDEALKIASNWIEYWYKKRVRFSITRTENIDSYMASHFQKLPVPGKWLRYPYALDGSDTVARFVTLQTSALQGQSIPVLKSYVPDSVKALITTPEDAAKNLLNLYDQKLRIWRGLRTPNRVAYFDAAFPRKHSYWYWERLFESVQPDQVADHLIVTNVMLLDDALSDAPPHSLLRGGLLNGMAEEESIQAVVSTFPILTDVPAVSDLRDTAGFSSKDRVLALAHIIAHEFGAHVIQGYKDVYDHQACLAVPTSGLAYTSTLNRLFSGSPCALKHPMIDRKTNLTNRYESMAHRYLEIKDYVAARDMVEKAIRLEPKRPLLNLMLRQLKSKTEK